MGRDTPLLYIFDLDGTLADITHRRSILDNLEDSYRWDKFYEACDMDLPNVPVIKVLNNLRLLNDVYIFSGRSVAVKAKTIDWISRYTSFSENELKE